MTAQAQTQTPAATEALELATTELDAVVGGLNKVGMGTLTLSATNTYRGTTTVNEGVLV